jgi:hypothetical protein
MEVEAGGIGLALLGCDRVPHAHMMVAPVMASTVTLTRRAH